jgi:hypothetical protein
MPIPLRLPLLAAALLLPVPAATAQDYFERDWERSRAQGNMPAFMGDGEDYRTRTLAYGVVDDGTGTRVPRLFVAASAPGPAEIFVLDPDTGATLGALNTGGVLDAATGRALNDVEVSDDGVIIACSEVNNIFLAGASQPFRCYRWTTLTAAAELVLEYTPPDANNDGRADWVGTLVSVVGSASDNSLTIWTAAVRNSPNVYRFRTTDNGASFTAETLVVQDNTSVTVEGIAPVAPGVAPFYHNIAGQEARYYTAELTRAGTVTEAEVTPFSTATKYFEAGDRAFLLMFNYESGVLGQRAELLDATLGPDEEFWLGDTGSLGSGVNFQANGDVDFRVNEDGSVTVFVLAANNGVGAYTTLERFVSVEGDAAAPAALAFTSVAPNPVRSAATVRYHVQASGPVALDLYDVLGRHVRSVFAGVAGAGPNETALSLADLPAGRYVLRLTGEAGVATRSITVLP